MNHYYHRANSGTHNEYRNIYYAPLSNRFMVDLDYSQSFDTLEQAIAHRDLLENGAA
jgi:hypothetical protein